MTQNRRSRESFFSQIDVSHGGGAANPPAGSGANLELTSVLREMLAAPEQQGDKTDTFDEDEDAFL